MSSEEVVIDVKNLSKCYEIYNSPKDRLKQLVFARLYSVLNVLAELFGKSNYFRSKSYSREFWALNNVSFSIRKGETFGIIGRNGSGKSTLLQILAGTLTQTSGAVSIKGNGRIAALLELGSGFNPEFTGRENVFLNAQILGLTQQEIESRYDEIVRFADIGDFIDQPVKTYSSGMFVRLAFAVQAHIDASIVIIDEALAVGDVFFRQKCYARLEELRRSGAAILLVSHSMTDIEQFCERSLLLDRGVPIFIGPSSQASKHYYMLHQEVNQSSHSLSTLDQGMLEDEYDSQALSLRSAGFYQSLKGKVQINNGQAVCLGVCLFNEASDASNTFKQGEKVKFYYEYELTEDIDVPICGVVIKSDKGVIVHGKNSWQFNKEVPCHLLKGSKVRCTQEVKLDLAPGEYTFELGFASVSYETWLNRENVSELDLHVKATRICIISDAGVFSVGYAYKNGVRILTHHGLTDLIGDVTIDV